MPNEPSPVTKPLPPEPPRRMLARWLKIVGGLLAFALVVTAGVNWWGGQQADRFQRSLAAFYATPDGLASAALGDVLRSEAMAIAVPGGGTATRILYRSELADGTPAVSSGMVFVPPGPAPDGGRPVVAWAHPTLGFGDECTPSRSEKAPLKDMDGWLEAMMLRGWVVTATDYVGIGTEGDAYYLIGESETRDLVNAVRAARNLPGSQAGTRYAVWGHSQGGHSALFAGMLAEAYAPDLRLVGVAAAAPAAELAALFAQQWSGVVAWAIGPDTALSWPKQYPELDVNAVLGPKARSSYVELARGCVANEVGTLAFRKLFDEKFFGADPMAQKTWFAAASAQTVRAAEIKVPVYIAQGTTDEVVLPNTTALFARKACAAGVKITVDWLYNVGHMPAATTSGLEATGWIADRFADAPAGDTCSQGSPVAPASEPSAP